MTPSNPPGPSLARRLGLRDAVVIGLAAMIGAGVFSVFAPAAAAAGSAMLWSLGVAAVVAFANASSTGQLAARYPESGGAYRYGRERLGEWSGFFAGWGFVIGKTASCAAMAITFGAYAAPSGWERPVAIAAVLALCGVNLVGITRTARLATAIVAAVLVVLAIVVASGATGGWSGGGLVGGGGLAGAHGGYGVLQAAGLLFFAFAGYARIATLGDEVREPARTIPRAIAIALTVVVALYLAIAIVALGSLGATRLAGSAAPLADVVIANGWQWAAPVVRVGAAISSLGALLALIAGVGRTSLAMARDGELPAPLARVGARHRVPVVAEVAVAIAVIALIVLGDLRGAIGFSSFGVLVYYLIANLSAIGQPAAERRVPRWLSALGALGCVVLAAALPWPSVLGGLVLFAVGAGYRALRLRLQPGLGTRGGE